jgi:hypothetical protein
MEPKFQTSFIPKKPLSTSSSASSNESSGSRGNSLIFMIGVFVFVISLLVAGGAFAWGKFLEARQVQLGEDLKVLAKDYKVELISLFKQTDTKISIAKELLDNHVAMSQVFGLISRFTAENIRFINLDLSAASDNSKGVTIKMSGYAPSYEALAFQSDRLGHLEDYDLRNVVINPAISGPTQATNGTVSFEFSANIVPKSLSYKNTFTTSSSTVDSNTSN